MPASAFSRNADQHDIIYLLCWLAPASGSSRPWHVIVMTKRVQLAPAGAQQPRGRQELKVSIE